MPSKYCFHFFHLITKEYFQGAIYGSNVLLHVTLHFLYQFTHRLIHSFTYLFIYPLKSKIAREY